MKFLLFTLFLIFNFYKINGIPHSAFIIEAYRCEEVFSTTCTLRNILFNDGEAMRFIPKYNKALVVTKVVFQSSRIPILTSDLCDNFPSVRTIEMKNVSLKEILPGAFNGCKKLSEINLQDNFLEVLDKNTFQENQLLINITLNNNNLTEIPKGLFTKLSSVQKIDLTRNQLTRLPAERFSGLESMKNLSVQSNPLLSFEIEEMYKEMPNLKNIFVRDTDLTCNRIKEIVDFCTATAITHDGRTTNDIYYARRDPVEKRIRSYTINTNKGFECLSDEQHLREVLFRKILSKLNNNTITNERDLENKLEDFKDAYSSKLDNMVKEMNATQSAYLYKIFVGQNFMFKLLKDTMESLENKLNNRGSEVV